MSENEFNEAIEQITTQAKKESKKKIKKNNVSKKEAPKTAKIKVKRNSKQKEKAVTSYTAVIVAKLEYDGAEALNKEKLAEELGHTIMKWADQKGFYNISSKESIPKLISVDVDIK